MEKKYPILLFDLDGTIINSMEGVTRSVEYALNELGIQVEDRASLTSFIGPPLTVGFPKNYPQLTPEQVDFAISKYRERYHTKGVNEHCLYDGVRELIISLNKSGRRLILATSKPLYFAKQIMDHYELTQYFEDVVGCGLNGELNTKAEVINHALEKNGLLNSKKDILMVGDTHYDVVGAHANELECIGVLYGFGNEEDLKQANVDYIAADMNALAEFLNSH